jgi:hypothetical protein
MDRRGRFVFLWDGLAALLNSARRRLPRRGPETALRVTGRRVWISTRLGWRGVAIAISTSKGRRLCGSDGLWGVLHRCGGVGPLIDLGKVDNSDATEFSDLCLMLRTRRSARARYTDIWPTWALRSSIQGECSDGRKPLWTATLAAPDRPKSHILLLGSRSGCPGGQGSRTRPKRPK